MRRGAALPPGPRLPRVAQAVGFWTRPLAFHERCRARYGTPYTLRLIGAPPVVFLAGPDEIKAMFTAPADVLHPGESMRVIEAAVGSSSILLLDGDAHLEQRRLMLPAFHGERMERLAALVQKVAERAIESWPTGRPIALHERLQALTLEVILRAVFGLDPGERLDRVRERIAAMIAIAVEPVTIQPGFQIGPRWKRFVRLREAVDAELRELVAERREAGACERDDVLALLLAARHEDGSELAAEELRDELVTLLVAGHETTASSLGFALERLPHEPRVVARLREELAGGGDEYLNAVIYEVMRRRPVLIGSAPRVVKEPIEIGDYRYPAGVALTAAAYLVHHDPAIYPEPYAFRPERFLEEPPGTYTWIPFGGGRRRCLGASFALMEMRAVLRSALERFELEPVGAAPQPPRRRSITVAPGPRAQVVLR